MNDVVAQQQTISFCGVNAHFQSGVAERRIRELQDGARTSMIHAKHRWGVAMDAQLWPYALRHRNDVFNSTQKVGRKLSPLEAFTTSGGLGTMCETFHGRVDNLDYKTMRYPGHVDLMNFFFHQLLMRERRDEAGRILTHAKPPVDDDIVYVHVASEGESDGRLQRIEYVRAFRPREIAGQAATAIAWTTAGSVVAVIEMVRQGMLGPRGFVKQEEIPFDLFTATATGALFAD